MLLTQKSDNISSLQVDKTDLKTQWKLVQSLSDIFWKRWRTEFLHTLQVRRKWNMNQPSLKSGDVVLLKDKEVSRNEWPTGVIVEVFPSSDGKIRKAQVCVIRNDKRVQYTRPISELILLVTA